MGPAFYIMAILGCGDAGAACEQVRVADAQYASADACTAAIGAILSKQDDISYPEVVAECRPASAIRTAAQAVRPRG